MEQLFEQVKSRYRKAEEYFRGPFESDTAHNKSAAETAFKSLKQQLEEVWEKVRYKVLEFNESEDCVVVGDVVAEAEKMKEEFWLVKCVTCYKRSKKIMVRLERPEFWKHTEIIEG
jgi:hypothetical protein